ncbi:hypothetical protein WDV06_26625 [Streptomyces racemochromogenes]|uniref:Uncharacterized protein n=1 Tax=Streptomyces racemochromogenes TaxID=67353 RepID=A0ABW7PJQ3_9ACTN
MADPSVTPPNPQVTALPRPSAAWCRRTASPSRATGTAPAPSYATRAA